MSAELKLTVHHVTMAVDPAQNLKAASVRTIDMTPTWGEVGRIMGLLIKSKEWKALEGMADDLAMACAQAEALRVISRELPDELAAKVAQILETELRKQGH